MPALGLTMQEIEGSAAIHHHQAPGLPSPDGSLAQQQSGVLETVDEEAWLMEAMAQLARTTVTKQDLSAYAQRASDTLGPLAAEYSQQGRTDVARLLSSVAAEPANASATLQVLHNASATQLEAPIPADSRRASAVG